MQTLVPETTLGRFKLIAPLGKGGMGEVWKARDERLGREVAIKILPLDLANEDLRVRFARESRILAALNHPHIAQIYEAGEEIPVSPRPESGAEKISFLVMEFIDGRSLSQALSSGPLPVLTVVRLARQIARALGAAHKAGIIHRDLKPANIMLTMRNQVKVLDFGLARPTAGGAGGLATLPEVTVSGMILGTAAYLSPEQVRGEAAGIASDIWAFGCVLYQMLGGRRPFPGESIPEILAAILRDDPEDLSRMNPGVPPPLSALVHKCLNKDPGMRPASAYEIAATLKDIFHQVRPASAVINFSSDSIGSDEKAQATLQSVESINRFLKSIDASFPAFSSRTVPMSLEIRYRGTNIGLLLSTKDDGNDVLAFVSPLFQLPAPDRRAALYRKLLALSNGHTDVAAYSLDSTSGMVNVICVRACDSLDAFHFQHTLEMMAESSALAAPLRKEFAIS